MSCILAGGDWQELPKHQCNRKDDSAKPEVSKVLTVGQLYEKVDKQNCINSNMCTHLDL